MAFTPTAKPTSSFSGVEKAFAIVDYFFQDGSEYTFQDGDDYVFDIKFEGNWTGVAKPS